MLRCCSKDYLKPCTKLPHNLLIKQISSYTLLPTSPEVLLAAPKSLPRYFVQVTALVPATWVSAACTDIHGHVRYTQVFFGRGLGTRRWLTWLMPNGQDVRSRVRFPLQDSSDRRLRCGQVGRAIQIYRRLLQL